ncbi:hypothetical protein AK88_03855 [Plasmodium fragile]|nr:uncharacterized protein AK88_03855 [Plasmodium fragile]KJP86479.1 hypothetical protein AK88_03855 [Plasmodium fragile]
MKKDAWKKWVARQHALMNTYSEQEWFQHLLEHIAQDNVTAADNAPANAEVPIMAKDLEVENVTGTQHMLRVRDLPRSQLHRQTYMKKRLTAKTWILILALVIEQCELESRLQEKELYVDELLDKL